MDSKLRGAIIGYGFISAQGHGPAYAGRPDVKITALADISPARREAAHRAWPEATIYSTHSQLLRAEEGQLDFVDISAPPSDHAEIAHAAFNQNLHVLCEKPLAVSITEAREMLEHARRVRRVLFPCHNYKHAPVVKAIQEIIQSGRIGQVRSLTLNTFRNTHAKGVSEWKTHWRRERRHSGGGIAMDHGSHSFYLTFDWLGSYPTAITAKLTNSEPSRYDTEDTFSAVLTFPTGLAHAHLTWTAGVRKVIYTVQGERGAITVDDDELQLSVMKATDGPDIAQGAVEWETERKQISSNWMDASHVTWFNSLFDQFRHAIKNGDYVGKEALESYLCIQLIMTAYRSAREGSRELPLDSFS